jgi:anaerobic magnesium-protoporphyrin IX monomethyl ester cyclase
MPNTIHLINVAPPFRLGMTNVTYPPSGILYVGGYLKKHGYKVEVHNVHYKNIKQVATKIADDTSTLFAGFSVKTGKQVTYSALMCKYLKEIKSDLPIVWGGIHPSLMPNECLEYDFVDYVVIGEGEITALELTEFLSKKTNISDIKGIGYKANKAIKINESRPFEKNIDKFSQDWDLVDIQKYVYKHYDGSKKFFYITSRGCPHNCGFCYNQEFNKRRWRAHSVDFVINDLKQIKEKTGINVVQFHDDNFFTNRERGLTILRKLKEIGIIQAYLELRIDYINEDLIQQLVDLGVKWFFTGWESGSRSTLDKIAKGFTPEIIVEKIKILSKFKNLTADSGSIIAFPWEDKKDIDDTVSLALKLFEIMKFRFDINLGIYIPYPGAPVTSDAINKGFKFPSDYEGWSKFDVYSGEMELPWLTKQDAAYYNLMGKYFKMLRVFPFLKFPIRQSAYIAASMAYLRLKTKIFVFPFETWITDWVEKRELKKFDVDDNS